MKTPRLLESVGNDQRSRYDGNPGRERPEKSVRSKDISGWHVAFILIKLKSNGRFPAPMDYELGI